MYEFQSFAYLDVQKTGSSFITYVLRKFCSERKIQKEKHAPMQKGYDPQKFYFISVRNPLDQYISLYSYGCQSRGKIFLGLKRHALGHLYDGTWNGFKSWLDFILDHENAALLGEEYGREELKHLSGLVGLQSYRVLALSIPDSARVLSAARTVDDVRSLYQSKNIANFTVRHERLRAELAELVGTRLRDSMSDLEAALRYIAEGEPRNVSERIDRYEERSSLSNDQLRRLEKREWLLHEAFGY